MINLFRLLVAASFFAANFAQAACINEAGLKQLNAQELQYMLNRVPPAFKHAVSDGQITYTHHLEDPQNCIVRVNIELPQAHIAEAQAELDADPSKKILLFAQGYSLPDKTEMTARYRINPDTLMANPNEVLQSGELGSLRASIEMMYSLITQKRLNELSEKTTVQWSKQALDEGINHCESLKKDKQYCACNVNFFAQYLAPRDYDNVQYSQSNPYAVASVKNVFVSDLVQKSERACSK